MLIIASPLRSTRAVMKGRLVEWEAGILDEPLRNGASPAERSSFFQKVALQRPSEASIDKPFARS